MTMTMTMTTREDDRKSSLAYVNPDRKSSLAYVNPDNSQDDDEDHSKMADSGLGGCDRCEGNDKLVRTCSCQSFYEPANACNKR